MSLLEIVCTPRASLQAVVTLLDVGKKIKKTSIVVGNCTGFAVYRMFFPYTQAALLLVDHGMDVYKIDQACTEFGMPIGSFRYLDNAKSPWRSLSRILQLWWFKRECTSVRLSASFRLPHALVLIKSCWITHHFHLKSFSAEWQIWLVLELL